MLGISWYVGYFRVSWVLRVQPMFGQTQNVGYTRNILQMFDCCLYYAALCAKLEDGPFVSQCSNRDILVIWEFLLILSLVSLFNKPTNWVAQLISDAIKVAVMCSFFTYQTFFWQFKEQNVSDENSPERKWQVEEDRCVCLSSKIFFPVLLFLQQIRSTAKSFSFIFVW